MAPRGGAVKSPLGLWRPHLLFQLQPLSVRGRSVRPRRDVHVQQQEEAPL